MRLLSLLPFLLTASILAQSPLSKDTHLSAGFGAGLVLDLGLVQYAGIAGWFDERHALGLEAAMIYDGHGPNFGGRLSYGWYPRKLREQPLHFFADLSLNYLVYNLRGYSNPPYYSGMDWNFQQLRISDLRAGPGLAFVQSRFLLTFAVQLQAVTFLETFQNRKPRNAPAQVLESAVLQFGGHDPNSFPLALKAGLSYLLY